MLGIATISAIVTDIDANPIGFESDCKRFDTGEPKRPHYAFHGWKIVVASNGKI
jgi:hypothetical protein